MSEDWPRIIVHADMDAFYAAVEQLDDPSLRGRPLLVGSDSARGVVLTASYEARVSGAGSAMPMHRARRLCPEALVVPPRFERYQEISELVMRTFGDFSPVVEPLSLDEAFLDMTGSTRLFGDPKSIGLRIKDAVRESTGGLTASVGISATRYVAKVASGFRKPDGLTIVPPASMREWLAPQPVANLWGAGPKTAERLRTSGFETIGQVASADAAALEGAFGALEASDDLLPDVVDESTVHDSTKLFSIGRATYAFGGSDFLGAIVTDTRLPVSRHFDSSPALRRLAKSSRTGRAPRPPAFYRRIISDAPARRLLVVTLLAAAAGGCIALL